MPTLKESANIDTNQLRRVPTPTAPVGVNTVLPTPDEQMSQFMHASLPVLATTYDSLTRQYYGRRVPHIRVLPVGGRY